MKGFGRWPRRLMRCLLIVNMTTSRIVRRAFESGASLCSRRMMRYGKGAQKSVKRAMHKRKQGTLTSGKKGTSRVKSRKQAIAIGLSEARKKGAKVPRKK